MKRKFCNWVDVFITFFKVKHPFKNLWAIYKTVKQGGYKKVFVFSQHPIVVKGGEY